MHLKLYLLLMHTGPGQRVQTLTPLTPRALVIIKVTGNRLSIYCQHWVFAWGDSIVCHCKDLLALNSKPWACILR